MLANWREDQIKDGKHFVLEMLSDEFHILRRIGIYIINKKWDSFRDLYPHVITQALSTTGRMHEFYHLLKEHFADLTNEQQAATLAAIRNIPQPENITAPERALKRIQQGWLSAIVGLGCAEADKWMSELDSDPEVGRVPDHPDFDSYMATWSGPGASPYTVAELLAFANSRALVDKLNAFETRDIWQGPTQEGLAAAFERSVRTTPEAFAGTLRFLAGKTPIPVLTYHRIDTSVASRRKR